MYTPLRSLALRFLRIPLEPHPPLGAPESVRIFRAGLNYYRLRLFGWSIGQVLAFAFLLFWVGVFLQVESYGRGAAPLPSASEALNRIFWQDWQHQLARIIATLPGWTWPLVWAVKILGLLFYLFQLPFSYALFRFDYEMRWYIVTDRSLRIRTGAWSVREITMSFANLQQVVVSQGPLQRLLGLSDVQVESAGGGVVTHTQHGPQITSLHSAHFQAVENGPEIRDLILSRLRRFKETGLGDPDEPQPESAIHPSNLLAAARALTTEARALREAFSKSS